MREKNEIVENKEMLEFREAERKRIADELHDTTVQDLICLSQQLEIAYYYMDKDPIRARLEVASSRKKIKDIINQMRETIYDLRPMAFDDIGWESAIDKLHHDIMDKNDINVTFDVENIKELDRISELAIYRIINEACTNVIKHAKAKHLKVEVHKVMEEIHINICDDGIGIKESDNKKHFGMTMIKERVNLLGGEVKIITGSNGTTINVKVPIYQ